MSLASRARTGPGRAREYAKIALRSTLHHRNLDLVSNPYPVRVATALRWLGCDVVLDVGANIGQYAAALQSSGYGGRIISCEPLPDAFVHLARRARNVPSWTTLRTAVGDAAGELTINVSANSFSSSAMPMTRAHSDAAPGSDYVSTVRAPVTTVAELVTKHDVNPARTLLKIDTQGYEGPVLDGAGDLLGRFAAVQLELSVVPLYEGQALHDELVGRLADRGYDVYGVDAGFADPHTGRMLQYDGLFVRRDLVPAAAR